MKKDLLFPNSFRVIGWVLAVPAAILGLSIILGVFHTPIAGEYTDEIATLGLLFGLIFIGFARQRVEDEMIRTLRLEALQWGLYINYLLLTIAVLMYYNDDFFRVLVYNMFTGLLAFIVRFFWLLRRSTHGNSEQHEE